MKRSTLVVGVGSLAFAVACGTGDEGPSHHTPLLDELSSEADGQVDVVDRAAALEGAADHDQAALGPALDLTTTGRGFRLDIDSEGEVQSLEGEIPRASTYDHVLRAVGLAAAADLVTTLVVGPPAAAIGITANGAVVEVGDNVWVATNAVSDGATTVTGTFVVAWVGVGWVCEMRLTSTDGRYNGTKWFNGFVSTDGNLGWWDLYDANGTLVGVVEWIADGNGNGEFAIGALAGDPAGDVLSYWFWDGEALVNHHDASLAEDTWVYVAADASGEVRAHDYNGGAPGCWASASAEFPYADAACE